MNTDPLHAPLCSTARPPSSANRGKLAAPLALAFAVACVALAGDAPDTPVAKRVAKAPPTAKPKARANALLALSGHGYGQPDRRFDSAEAMHADHFHRFESAPGFGMSRVLVMPRASELTLAYESYLVPKPDLIALEDKPHAYISPFEIISVAALTNKTSRARLQSRALTELEIKAVADLREGRNLVVQEAKFPVELPGGTVEVPCLLAVGALRAKASCAKCHEVAEGTLLGAFSYTLYPTNAFASRTIQSAPAAASR